MPRLLAGKRGERWGRGAAHPQEVSDAEEEKKAPKPPGPRFGGGRRGGKSEAASQGQEEENPGHCWSAGDWWCRSSLSWRSARQRHGGTKCA
jgi:hypothetical protein